MSSDLRRKRSGPSRDLQKDATASGLTIESNLGKLGFLGSGSSKPTKHKKSSSKSSSRHPKSKDVLSAAHTTTTSSNISRATSAASHNSTGRYSSNRSTSSRPGRGMASVLDIDHSRNRKDRTFIGGECAVCEEQLELTLRGERILQLACGHISHEACFYEYLREFDCHTCPICNAPLSLDSSRGGAVPNIELLSNAVRQQDGPIRQRDYAPSTMTTQTPWEERTVTEQTTPGALGHRTSQSTLNRNQSVGRMSERAGTTSEARHARNGSETTAPISTQDYAETQSVMARRHDYDLHSMEAAVTSPRAHAPSTIPNPIVLVRSEFPTLTRSRQQQSLTCLVTVEVGEPNWRMDGSMSAHQNITGNASDYGGMRSPQVQARPQSEIGYENSPEEAERITQELHNRVENWHGLDLSRFGKLRLHSHIRVGKDRRAWQDLDCYLFTDMLICVKERKTSPNMPMEEELEPKKSKCTLKGSILIRKHLKNIETSTEENILTLTLSVSELPAFYLQFRNRQLLEVWRRALLNINNPNPSTPSRGFDYDQENYGTDEEEYRAHNSQRLSSVRSSGGAAKSYTTAPTEYSHQRVLSGGPASAPTHFHVPLDIVIVVPVTSSMQGLKINLLRDALRFLVSNLGERDRMGLVTFGSSNGSVPLVGMTSKTWSGWNKVLESIRPVGQKSLRADVVEGANAAMDLLMQRRSANPLAAIMLISDSATSDPESVDFVVQRAEAAKVVVHSFGLGAIHRPDTMIELSTRTKASYTYIKDWMMLRECLAGVFGSLQSTSHQNVKLKLRLPEGSPAKFVKISGALHYTKRATGKDAEAALGDMRFGDKRDILVQLVIAPDNSSQEQPPHDAWESIVSGLEALSGTLDSEEQRNLSVEEVPLITADLSYGDLQKDGATVHLSRPSLLAITMLPPNPRAKSGSRPPSPPIPPHPHVVQRRMELLTSDMLSRALTLVSRGQHERAQHLLTETRSILKGLGKGGLPPLPSGPPNAPLPKTSTGQLSTQSNGADSPSSTTHPMDADGSLDRAEGRRHTPSPPQSMVLPPTSPTHTVSTGPPTSAYPPPSSLIDHSTVAALEAELDSSLEWISHPAVFSRDSRKAVLQAIGVISSQRAYTTRTQIETLWADRIEGIKKITQRSKEWRDVTNQQGINDGNVLVEES